MARKSSATKGEVALGKSKKNSTSKNREIIPSSLDGKLQNSGKSTKEIKSTIEEAAGGFSGSPDSAQDMSCAPTNNAAMSISKKKDEIEETGSGGDLKYNKLDTSGVRPSKRRRRCEKAPSVSDSSDERAEQDQTMQDQSTPVIYKGSPRQEVQTAKNSLDTSIRSQFIPATDNQSTSNLTSASPEQIPMNQSSATNAVILEDSLSIVDSLHRRSLRLSSFIENRTLLLDRLKRCREIAQKNLDAAPKLTFEEERAEYQKYIREAVSRKRVASVSPNQLPQQKTTKRSSSRRSSASKQKNNLEQHYAEDITDIGNVDLAGSTVPSTAISLANLTAPSSLKTSNSSSQILSTVSEFSVQTPAEVKREPGLTLQSHIGGLASSASSKKLLVSNKSIGKRLTSSGKGKKKSASNTADINLCLVSAPMQGVQDKGSNSIRVSVHCPELAALRERRGSILKQLSSLGHNALVGSAKSIHQIDSKKSNQQSVRGLTPPQQGQPLQLMRYLTTPFRLPSRRKTHWDYVMEEIRWLATDFIEERKWKMTAARTLSSAVALNERKRKSIRQIQKDTGDPTANDLKCTKALAKILSSSVVKFWSLVAAQGVLVRDGVPLWQTYHQLNDELALDLQRGTIVTSKKDVVPIDQTKTLICERDSDTKKEDFPFQNSSQCDDSCMNPGKTHNPEDGSGGRLENPMFIDATHYSTNKVKLSTIGHSERTTIVEKATAVLTKVAAKTKKLSSSELSIANSDVDASGLMLMPFQLKALHWVETLWALELSTSNTSIIGTGAIIAGGCGTGKTVAIGFLLWSLRMHGPQLVVCTPQNLIRWRHELRKFCQLNVMVLGYDSCSKVNLRDDFKLQAGDILLCELASIRDIDESISLLATLWGTIVLDCRFSAPMASPLNVSTYLSWVPAELDSHSWWRSFLKLQCLNGLPGKRVLIDVGGVSLGSKLKDAESWARKLAFVLPNVFDSSSSQAIRWAKKQHHVDGRSDLFKNENRSCDLLQSIVNCFIFSPDLCEETHISVPNHCSRPTSSKNILRETCIDETELITDQSTHISKQGAWVLRFCSMNDLQKDAYSRCCKWVKGALSVRATPVAARALLKLRSLCLHSDTSEVLNGHETQQRIFAGVGVGVSNVKVAQSIVDGSSKMRELLRILLDEAKTESLVTIYNANGHLTLRRSTFHRVASVSDATAVVYCNGSSKGGEGFQKRSPKNNLFPGIPASGNKKKKVLILASLPEALLLVHIFLNSCGIAHEFLTSFTPNVLHGSLEKNEMMQLANFSQISAWVEAQRVLARFDRASFEDCNNSPRCDVLLANPAGVGAAHVGLSPGAADMIVSVDEDWTNQGKMMIESIIKYCQSRHSDRFGRSFQLIKLICADTCEESFLVSGVSNSNKMVSSFPESLDSEDVDSANATIDAATVKKTENENIDFASSIIRLRNQELSLVLKSPLSLDFSSGFPPIFLPRHNISNESLQKQHEENLAFANELVLAETSMRTIPPNSYISHSNSPYSPVGEISCDKVNCLPGLIGRRDLNSLSLRIHCFLEGRSLRSFERDVQIETLSRSLASDIRYEKELAEAWQRAGLGCSPGDQTETLLFYAMAELQKFPSAAESVKLSHLPNSEQTVLNPDLIPSSVYALSYSSNRTKFHDGHSSREPLIYSPPLIPGWGLVRTIDDKRRFHPVDASVSPDDNKIHTLPIDAAVESTLLNDVMELEMDIDLIPDIDSSTFSGEIVTPFSIGVDDKKSFLDQFEGMNGEKSGSTTVGESHADYPLLTLPSTCDEVQRDSDAGASKFRHSVDDKIRNISDSISIVSVIPIETGKYRYWRDSLETNFDALTLEPEDFWVSRSCFLESMLLYVNHPLQTTGQAKATMSKKNKRKLISMNSNEPGQSNPISCAPFRIPNLQADASLLPVVQTQNKGREGLMLFLIQEKLDDVVQQKLRAPPSNIVDFKSLPHDSFGLGPCPFGLGEIGGPSCTRDFLSPKVEAGVFLQHTHIEDNIAEHPWSEEEDATLVRVALRYVFLCLSFYCITFSVDTSNNISLLPGLLCHFRYSLNWDIVASFVRKLSCTTLRSWWRSPRDCRDRWKHLTTMRPSVLTEARKAENNTRKMSLLPAYEVRCYFRMLNVF